MSALYCVVGVALEVSTALFAHMRSGVVVHNILEDPRATQRILHSCLHLKQILWSPHMGLTFGFMSF